MGPSRLDVQHLAGALVVLLAALLAVVPAVDPACDLAELPLVGQLVEAVRLPEPAGDAEADLRLRRLLGVLLQVQPQRLAGPAVVGPACDLDRPAPLVAL